MPRLCPRPRLSELRVARIEIRGHGYERIRYTPRGARERAEFLDRCPGCGIRRGNFHHVGWRAGDVPGM